METANLERIKQELVAPPFLPKHEQVATGVPKIVEVTLEVVEKEMEIAPGVFIQAMTFNGTNPDPLEPGDEFIQSPCHSTSCF